MTDKCTNCHSYALNLWQEKIDTRGLCDLCYYKRENARLRNALVDIEYLADDGADYCTDKGPNGYMEILSVARGAFK